MSKKAKLPEHWKWLEPGYAFGRIPIKATSDRTTYEEIHIFIENGELVMISNRDNSRTRKIPINIIKIVLSEFEKKAK